MGDKKAKKFLKKYGVMFIGILARFCFYIQIVSLEIIRISFTNLMYQSAPWDTLDVKTAGPCFPDVIDSFTRSCIQHYG